MQEEKNENEQAGTYTVDGDIGGKKILKENLDSLKIVSVQAGELQDIDRKEDLGTA